VGDGALCPMTEGRLAVLAERCYNYGERRNRRQALNKEGSKAQTKLIFDASSLITAAQFGVGGRLAIEFVAGYVQVIIPEGVKAEAVDFGLQAGYSDALELDRLIKAGAITVEKAQPVDPPFETVVAAYDVEPGDVEILRLCRRASDYDYVVVDDRLLYLILHRFAMRPIFLPDLIVAMAKERAITEDIGEQLLEAIRSRYRTGFIEHSLQVLKGVL
jgi:hypothetical protein